MHAGIDRESGGKRRCTTGSMEAAAAESISYSCTIGGIRTETMEAEDVAAAEEATNV